MNAPTILRKLDGRTNVVVEERPLTISRTDFIEAIETLWPAARFEYNDELVRVSVEVRPGALHKRHTERRPHQGPRHLPRLPHAVLRH